METNPAVALKLITWHVGDPTKPVSVMLLHVGPGVTNDQPVGRFTLNMFAGAPVTAVAEIVSGVAFIPVIPISEEEVAVAVVSVAAEAAVTRPNSEALTRATIAVEREKSVGVMHQQYLKKYQLQNGAGVPPT